MRDPDEGTADGPTETLEAGPSRPPLFVWLPARWRQRAAVPVAFALGIAAGAATVVWWPAEPRPRPAPFRPDEHAVELILHAVVPPPATPTRGPLHVKAALLLSGGVASTVSEIDASVEGLEVRAPGLPVTVSPVDRFASIGLWIRVRDCETAARWVPANRPFTISWRDEFDMLHTDRAGDFDRSTAEALRRYVDANCPDV